MNVIVPPVFDSVLFPDGHRYIPFEDSYTVSVSITSGTSQAEQEITPLLRDYTKCRQLTAVVKVTSQVDFLGTGFVAIGALATLIGVRTPDSPTNVYVRAQTAVNWTLTTSIPVTVKISGWTQTS